MISFKLGKPVISTIVASATIGFFCDSLNASNYMTNEVKLMTQNPGNNSKDTEIRLPDNVLKQVEKMKKDAAKRSQQKRADEFAKEMAKKTPKEREEIEKQLKKLNENKYAPETKSEEELKKEDESAIRMLNEFAREKK
jgi:hypothetical protein